MTTQSKQPSRRRRATASSLSQKKDSKSPSGDSQPTRRRRPKTDSRYSGFASVVEPDGYYYLELITGDLHATADIERELKARTSLAERCYTHSKIPVYRIPTSEKGKMKPWPFIGGQDKRAACCLPANNKQQETYVFLNYYDRPYLLNGQFRALSDQKQVGNEPIRRRRRRKS